MVDTRYGVTILELITQQTKKHILIRCAPSRQSSDLRADVHTPLTLFSTTWNFQSPPLDYGSRCPLSSCIRPTAATHYCLPLRRPLWNGQCSILCICGATRTRTTAASTQACLLSMPNLAIAQLHVWQRMLRYGSQRHGIRDVYVGFCPSTSCDRGQQQ